MFEYSINVPISRFRRELNTWMRFLDNEPENTIHITRNKKVISIAISPQRYQREKSNTGEKVSIPDDISQLVSIVFGSAVKGSTWLNAPLQVLNGDTPATRLKSSNGTDEIRNILYKIQYGEFS